MNTTHKVAVGVLALVLVLGLPANVVLAGDDQGDDDRGGVRGAKVEARAELRLEKKNVFEKFRERFESNSDKLKDFLGAGRAAIGSGTITAKTDTTLTVEKDGKSYLVNLGDKTQIRRRFWGKSDLSEFSVGNTVNVIGLWTDDTHTAINAHLVRNVSIQKRFGVFFGDVKSLVTNGWVMSTKSGNRADQTVTVSADTKFENRNGETITKADVVVGHKVRVRGLWDKTLNTVTEVTQVKDFSLPVQVEVKATVTPTP